MLCDMEELQTKHRQEQKDLQSRITQKKKSATKKTRKGVNDECAELERQLKEEQSKELNALGVNGESAVVDENVSEDSPSYKKSSEDTSLDIKLDLESLTLSASTIVSNGQAKKPNRQKARLARRAAEQEAAAEQAQKEATNLPNLCDQELESMRNAYQSKGLQEHEIRSDGHCLYAAVADQLQQLRVNLEQAPDIGVTNSKIEAYTVTRHVAAKYIFDHRDDFVPFLESPLDEYVKTIRDTGEWGGHLEILALAKAYGVNINVLRGDGRVEKIECGLDDDRSTIWLAYYRHSFGLGEHYNSLRKQD